MLDEKSSVIIPALLPSVSDIKSEKPDIEIRMIQAVIILYHWYLPFGTIDFADKLANIEIDDRGANNPVLRPHYFRLFHRPALPLQKKRA